MPKDLDCAAGGVLLRVWLSPFDYEPKAAVEIDAGTKVSDIVDRFMPKTLVRSVIHVWVGGEKVPESCWLSVRVLRGAFVTLRGSWNRADRYGYAVVCVPMGPDGLAVGVYQTFLSGWKTDDGQVWGRPVDVAVAGDGSLLVTDDGAGVIWRVTYGQSRKMP